MTSRVGLFGGTFDPIHRGHIEPVLQARERLGLDVVQFLVTANPPHKRRRFAPALARYVMVELALLDEPALRASALELTLDRPAYTVETIEAYRRGDPDSELVLLLGTDALAELHRWRRGSEIPRLAEVAVMTRPGWDRARVLEQLDPAIERELEAGRIGFVETSAVDCSSTSLRRALAAGEAPLECLAPRVLDYLRKYSHYDDSAD